MARTGGGTRSLSPKAAAVLLGLFAVLALVAWLVSAARSHAGTSSTTSTRVTAGAVPGAGSTRFASIPTVRLDPPGSGSGSSGSAGRTGAAGSTSARTGPTAGAAIPAAPDAGAPLRTKALYVLAVVDATGGPPSGYVGGRQFMNDTRGGTTGLPARSASGRTVTYHEYDVNPKRTGVNRGPERLVVGDDGSAWMTGDHYVTWQRLR